jgi:predicted phage terminase large subunit-like protein
LLRKRDLIGDRAWSALFQQDPHPTSGRLFSVDRLEIVDGIDPGHLAATIRAWDLAATSVTGRNDPDWTVGLKLSKRTDGRYVVLDVIRTRGTPRQVEDLIVNTARQDGRDVAVGIPEDPGQAGKSQMSYLTRQLAGASVIASRETGSKATRAMPVASQLEAGNLSALRAVWNQIFIDELREFPYGTKDDQVDALVRAFTALSGLPNPPRKLSATIFGR